MGSTGALRGVLGQCCKLHIVCCLVYVCLCACVPVWALDLWGGKVCTGWLLLETGTFNNILGTNDHTALPAGVGSSGQCFACPVDEFWLMCLHTKHLPSGVQSILLHQFLLDLPLAPTRTAPSPHGRCCMPNVKGIAATLWHS